MTRVREPYANLAANEFAVHEVTLEPTAIRERAKAFNVPITFEFLTDMATERFLSEAWRTRGSDS